MVKITLAQHVRNYAKKNRMKLKNAMQNAVCKKEWKKIKGGNSDEANEANEENKESTVVGGEDNNVDEKTVVGGEDNNVDEKTVVGGEDNNVDEKTVVGGGDNDADANVTSDKEVIREQRNSERRPTVVGGRRKYGKKSAKGKKGGRSIKNKSRKSCK